MLGRQSLRGLSRSLHCSQRALATSSSGGPLNGAASDPMASTDAKPSFEQASSNVRRPPPSPEHQASAASQEAGAKGSGSGGKIGWIVPVLGIPALIGWYLYDQGLVQQEHDTYIQSLHDGIKERRQQMATTHRALRPPAMPPAGQVPGEAHSAPGGDGGAARKEQLPAAGSGGPRDTESCTLVGAVAGGDGSKDGTGEGAEGGTGILSAVGSMEGQEQAEAGHTAEDVQAAAAAAEAAVEAQAAAAVAAAMEAQHLEQQRQQEQETELRRQEREQQEREQHQQQTAEQQAIEKRMQEQQLLQEGVDSAAAKHAAAHGYKYQPSLAKSVDAVLPAVPAGRMGVQVDLSPAGLIQFALERRQQAGGDEDWENFKARHGQAAADAELFAQAAQQIAAWHEAEMAQVQSIADRNAARVDEVTEMAKASTESFKSLLKQHREMAAELRDLEVRQAERRVVLAARKALEAERRARAEALDAVRAQLGALACAHDARAAQQSASRLSHAITLAVLDASAALESGASLGPHLQALLAAAQVLPPRPASQAMVASANAGADAARAAAGAAVDATLDRVSKTQGEGEAADAAGAQGKGTAEEQQQQQQQQLALQGTLGSAGEVVSVEEVVAAAVGSLPMRAATRGVATTQQLSARLQSMHAAVSQLALLPLAAQAQTVDSSLGGRGGSNSSATAAESLPPCPGLVGGGGMLAHAVARFAAWLKVDETKAVQALGPETALSRGSIEAALAVAKAQVAQGKLVAAADTLTAATAGTEAAAAVAAWCEAARERAVADQALRMLRAHATTLAASVI